MASGKKTFIMRGSKLFSMVVQTERVCLQRGRPGFDPWVGKMPWRGEHGNPLQGSCLENPHGQRSWHATVHGVAKSKTRVSDEAQHGKVSGG